MITLTQKPQSDCFTEWQHELLKRFWYKRIQNLYSNFVQSDNSDTRKSRPSMKTQFNFFCKKSVNNLLSSHKCWSKENVR